MNMPHLPRFLGTKLNDTTCTNLTWCVFPSYQSPHSFVTRATMDLQPGFDSRMKMGFICSL